MGDIMRRILLLTMLCVNLLPLPRRVATREERLSNENYVSALLENNDIDGITLKVLIYNLGTQINGIVSKSSLLSAINIKAIIKSISTTMDGMFGELDINNLFDYLEEVLQSRNNAELTALLDLAFIAIERNNLLEGPTARVKYLAFCTTIFGGTVTSKMFHYIVKPYLINKAGGFVLGKLLNGVGLVHMRISPNGWTSDLRTGIVFRTTEAAYALAPLNEIPANLIQRPCAIF